MSLFIIIYATSQMPMQTIVWRTKWFNWYIMNEWMESTYFGANFDANPNVMRSQPDPNFSSKWFTFNFNIQVKDKIFRKLLKSALKSYILYILYFNNNWSIKIVHRKKNVWLIYVVAQLVNGTLVSVIEMRCNLVNVHGWFGFEIVDVAVLWCLLVNSFQCI